MFQLVKSEVVPLTMELAREFCELPKSRTERDLIPRRLRYLRRQADAGLLVTFHWARALYDGTWVRMNGQHSSTMLCEMNGNFPTGLQVHLDEYKVETEHDLAELFRQFDHRGSSRSRADVSGAYQGLVSALDDVPKGVGKVGVEGVTWYRRNFLDMKNALVGDDQYNLFTETTLHDYLHWLKEILNTKDNKELIKIPVIAAMYGTFIKNENAARTFWALVGRGLKDGTQAAILDEWLEIPRAEQDTPIGEEEYFRGCIYAWNAYREERSIKEIRYDKRKAAQAISD